MLNNKTNMEKEIFQIEKEYILRVEGMTFPIRGRVMKKIHPEDSIMYRWEISHYCKQEKVARMNI